MTTSFLFKEISYDMGIFYHGHFLEKKKAFTLLHTADADGK